MFSDVFLVHFVACFFHIQLILDMFCATDIEYLRSGMSLLILLLPPSLILSVRNWLDVMLR